ncbi:hypothetical protein [Methanoregula sp.]|uniref:hypothetical protein n=1 Tax=Methanoregula sp. TaxID=2052170 RepID=UPI002B66A59E|nr:hypothetical protein [Methanoregula sp.]HVP97049.1 hypothetical protein [Methanoregula sp.]
MADFQNGTTTKTAFRNLTNPIEDATTFNAIVQAVVVSNPFGCVSYISGGVTHPGVEKTREAYTAKILYQDNEAKVVGYLTDRYSSLTDFTAGTAALLAAGSVTAAHGGIPARDFDKETYSATLKCHDPNGEIYLLHFNRNRIIISSYTDEAIRERIETWADTETALA